MIEAYKIAELDYQCISDEINRSDMTHRLFQTYCDFFDYNRDNLSGKLILDVGAGESSFAATANKNHNATVIKLDPQYPSNSFFWRKENAIKSIVQNLPFKDDVFDEVIAAYCLWWVRIGAKQSLLDMIRVTKPNGRIKIYPVLKKDNVLGKFSEIFKSDPIDLKEVEPGSRYRLTIDKEPFFSSVKWETVVDKIMSSVGFSP